MTTPRCEGQNFGELDQVAHGMHPLNGQLPGMGKLFWENYQEPEKSHRLSNDGNY